jgi:hypothetical protein
LWVPWWGRESVGQTGHPQGVPLPNSLSFVRTTYSRRTLREERVGHDLGGLPPCGGVAGPEIRAILRTARLSNSATHVPGHDPTGSQVLYPQVEGRAWWHVLEGLSRDRLDEPHGVHDYLRELASRNIIGRAGGAAAQRSGRRASILLFVISTVYNCVIIDVGRSAAAVGPHYGYFNIRDDDAHRR